MQSSKNPIDSNSTDAFKQQEVKSEREKTSSSRRPFNPVAVQKSNRKSTQIQYAAFKYKTSHKIWPLQEPALKNLDDLLEKENDSTSTIPNTNVNTNKMLNNRLVKEKQRGYDPLWSMEPRIFGMEEPQSGKRRYVTCHLGRFMHHYWRDCDSSSRHYYELIREGTPCRLYFGV